MARANPPPTASLCGAQAEVVAKAQAKAHASEASVVALLREWERGAWRGWLPRGCLPERLHKSGALGGSRHWRGAAPPLRVYLHAGSQ